MIGEMALGGGKCGGGEAGTLSGERASRSGEARGENTGAVEDGGSQEVEEVVLGEKPRMVPGLTRQEKKKR